MSWITKMRRILIGFVRSSRLLLLSWNMVLMLYHLKKYIKIGQYGVEKKLLCRHVYLLDVAGNLVAAYGTGESVTNLDRIISIRPCSLRCTFTVSLSIRKIVDEIINGKEKSKKSAEEESVEDHGDTKKKYSGRYDHFWFQMFTA